MKKLLSLSLIAIALSGCNNESKIITEAESKTITEAFTFAEPINKLEYASLGDNNYVVKADDQIYLYSPKSHIISPAPKAVLTQKNMLVEDAISQGKLSLNLVFDRTALKSIKGVATSHKVSSNTETNEESETIAPRQKNEVIENNSEVEKKPNVPDIAEINPKSVLAPAQPVLQAAPGNGQSNISPPNIEAIKAEGDAKLKELKEALSKKLGQFYNQSAEAKSSQSAPTLPQSPTPLKPVMPITQQPTVKLTSGQQFASFNGTNVLKIAYAEDGRLLTPAEKEQRIIEHASKIPMNWTINYPAVGKEKLQLFVFSDYTCPFCHKLHNDLQVLNNAGITVRYLFYPRAYSAGPRTPAAMLTMEQMRRAWCAPDQGEAMTQLFETRQLDDYKCDQVPEAKGRPEFPGPYHHFFGQLFDLDATPLYFTNDGQMNTGYSTFEDFKANKIHIPE